MRLSISWAARRNKASISDRLKSASINLVMASVIGSEAFFGPLDLLPEGRKFSLEFLRLSLPFGIQIDEVIHPHFLSNYRFLDDLLEVASSPASTSRRRWGSGLRRRR
jgi:hypothetical protein